MIDLENKLYPVSADGGIVAATRIKKVFIVDNMAGYFLVLSDNNGVCVNYGYPDKLISEQEELAKLPEIK